jgi:signal transduction histidine kinase
MVRFEHALAWVTPLEPAGPTVTIRHMKASKARALAHGIWLGTLGIWAIALIIVIAISPSDAVPMALLGLPMLTYASVGALVARTSPGNLIGWLFSSVGLALSLWMFGSAYAQIGLEGSSGIGDLPGATAAAWSGVLASIAVLPVALPVFLLTFPDGRLRSRRWRPVAWAIALGSVLLVVGTVAQTWKFDPLVLRPTRWVTEIPAIDHAYDAGLFLVFGTAFAGLLTLVLRFRESSAEQRQSLRLLVGMIVGMAFATALAIVTVLASRGAEWSWIAIVLAILTDGFGVLIGIPLATAAAVLTFGLYDVGVVVKKTVVYVVLVIFFVLLIGFLSLLLSPLAFIGSRGVEGGGERELVIARIATGVSIAVLVLVLTFRPMKRFARRLVYGRRATRYEAMAEFSERLGDAYSTEDVLPRMAEIVRASTGADLAQVWLHVGGEIRPVASSPSDNPMGAAIEAASRELPPFEGRRAFAVRDRGELLGALTVAMPAAESLSKDGEQLVTDLAGQAGLVLRNVRLVEELQESRRRIVTAQDERARKLERDIHDGAQQQLVALQVKQRLVRDLIERDPAKARDLMTHLQTDTTEALDDLRDLARGIYPPLLADKGLGAALESQARKSPVPISVETDGVERYPQDVEAAVYFCALEALNNLAKYASASRATVALAQANGTLTFAVSDDGVGFPVGEGTSGGTGLQGMADRLDAIGGALEIRSAPGEGTTILGRVPVG